MGAKYIADSRQYKRKREPAKYAIGNGSLNVAALCDVTTEYLVGLSDEHKDEFGKPTPGLVISCMDSVPEDVWVACQEVGWTCMPFHVG